MVAVGLTPLIFFLAYMDADSAQMTVSLFLLESTINVGFIRWPVFVGPVK